MSATSQTVLHYINLLHNYIYFFRPEILFKEKYLLVFDYYKIVYYMLDNCFHYLNEWFNKSLKTITFFLFSVSNS